VSASQDFVTHIVDLLEAFGSCDARRMFGGFGIFHQGLMFGLIADGNLYLKVDAQSREHFVAEGSSAFSYTKKNKVYQLSYFLAPDGFFEDETACLSWARLAFDAALRNPTKRKQKKS
jgi:DNA transformation protein